MENNEHQIGSWNGLTLVREVVGSSRGAHRHDLHMLRLQTLGTTVTEWRSQSDSGTTILQPGSLAVFVASARHGHCKSTPLRPQEMTEQIVALVMDTMLQDAAEAALMRAGSVRLEEKRKFRDLPLERMVEALREASAQQSPAGLLVGEMLSSAIVLHLVGTTRPCLESLRIREVYRDSSIVALSTTLRNISKRRCHYRRLRRKLR